MQFLSDEWVAALDSAAQGWPAPEGLNLTVQQVVSDPPGTSGGPAAYHLVFGDGRLCVRPGHAEAPDVTISQPYEIARSLSRGDANAQQALADGNLRVTGNLGLLAGHARTLATLEDLFAAVRSVTEY